MVCCGLAWGGGAPAASKIAMVVCSLLGRWVNMDLDSACGPTILMLMELNLLSIDAVRAACFQHQIKN
jgi:hypothetical protein